MRLGSRRVPSVTTTLVGDISVREIDAIFAAALKAAKATKRDDHVPTPQCALSGLVGEL